MLKRANAIATVGVRNIETARRFYEDALGLTLTPEQEPGTATYQTGSTTMFVYESQYAGSNKATSVTWDVEDDIEALVADLKGKGVAFEHYDLPGLTLQGDLHVAKHMKVAWFKDPDGNIHSLAGK